MSVVSLLLLLLAGQHLAGGSSTTNFKNYLVLLYKGNYVGYGNGRYSERDLPECGPGLEACNLSHTRFWLPPLVERLCRCPGHTACPLHQGGNTTHGGGRVLETSDEEQGTEAQQQLLVQHITNRAHLQFCNVGLESSGLQPCAAGTVGLTVQLVEHINPPSAASGDQEVLDSHTSLHCRCQLPCYWRLLNTSSQESSNSDGGGDAYHQQHRRHSLNRIMSIRTYSYECQQLPTCSSYKPCSEVRPDTYESYYTCSCPPGHLCLVPWGAGRVSQPPHTHPHYTGSTQQGVCTPHHTPLPRGGRTRV